MIHRTFLILFAVIFAYANTIFGINFEMVDLGLFESDESDAYAIDPDGTIHGSYRFQGKEYYFTWREDRGLMAQEKPFQAKVEDTGIITPKVPRIVKLPSTSFRIPLCIKCLIACPLKFVSVTPKR